MGLFITIEGGDGTGKTTVMNKVVELLEKEKYDIVRTREPGGTNIGNQIREVILNKENTGITGMCETMLFAADRVQHVEEVIIPNCKEGKIVISDRFFDSNLVYQGIIHGYGIDNVYNLNMIATKGIVPDLTLLFDLDPIEGQKRIASNKDREVNRLDLKSLEYHQKIREAYLEVAKKFPNRIIIVDASRKVEEIVAEVYQIIKNKIEMTKNG